MGIRFDDLIIPGFVYEFNPGPTMAVVNRAHHWGSNTETEIRSGTSGKRITVLQQLWSNAWTTEAIFWEWFKRLEKKVSQHGKLVLQDHITGAEKLSFSDTTFDSITPEIFGGAQNVGPFKDVANTLGDPSDLPAYWYYVRMEFYQLRKK